MTTDAFLQAILDEPDDDTPRLVFADWLDERGDVGRAGVIRVQCELARWVPEGGRRRLLQARERELRAAHRDEWLGGIRAFCAATFERGFPKVALSVRRASG